MKRENINIIIIIIIRGFHVKSIPSQDAPFIFIWDCRMRNNTNKMQFIFAFFLNVSFYGNFLFHLRNHLSVLFSIPILRVFSSSITNAFYAFLFSFVSFNLSFNLKRKEIIRRISCKYNCKYQHKCKNVCRHRYISLLYSICITFYRKIEPNVASFVCNMG